MKVVRRSLSKTRYVMGLQCHKRLWLHSVEGERPVPDAALQHRFDEGAQIGELARDLFPGGILISEDHTQLDQALQSTQAAIDSGATAIFEATFLHRDVWVRADILARTTPSAPYWQLYEVKSSSTVKEQNLDDLAVQIWAIEGAGLTIDRATIAHLNTKYIRHGPIDLRKLFKVIAVDEALQDKRPDVERRTVEMLNVLEAETEPAIEIGPHCRKPYDCEFRPRCWAKLPEYSVLDLTGSDAKRWGYFRDGIVEITDVPLDDTLGSNQQIQVELARSGGFRFDHQLVSDFLDEFVYPVHFFDFETANPAVPPHDGLKPYQAIPFQFSVHRLEHPGAKPTHDEFLNNDRSDPRAPLADAMLRALGTAGSIVVYSQSFEKRIFRELAEQLPQHRAEIAALADRVIDIATPFRKRWVANNEMRGKYSLKFVAPALLGETSDYAALEISEGTSASLGYLRMIALSTPPAERERLRVALLHYCAADTLNTVRIFEWLRKECLAHAGSNAL